MITRPASSLPGKHLALKLDGYFALANSQSKRKLVAGKQNATGTGSVVDAQEKTVEQALRMRTNMQEIKITAWQKN